MTTICWQQTSATDGNHLPCIIHSAHFPTQDDAALKSALETCTAKAISLLKENIQDDSLYLLFEWQPLASELNIVVTDANKTNDSPLQVHAHFTNVATGLLSLHEQDREQKIAETTESIIFFLHDYLASCNAFFSYSLVALFHAGSRTQTKLL